MVPAPQATVVSGQEADTPEHLSGPGTWYTVQPRRSLLLP